LKQLSVTLLSLALAGVAYAADPRGDNPDDRPLAPAAASRAFHVPPGFEVQLVANEPAIQKPMNLAFDERGRVWVTGSSLYPWPAQRDAIGQPIASFSKQWDENPVAFRATSTPPTPVENGADSVRILSDFDPATGRARKVEVFAEGLNIPIGILPLPRAPDAKGDSVIVFSIPAIWRLTDTDGDGRADQREKLYDGFGFRDTHGMSSNYWLWLDGWIYGTHGFSNRSDVTDRAGRVVTLNSGNTYRFRPDGSRFEVFANGQTNPFGLAFSPRGDVFTADSHSKPVYLLVPGGYYEGIGKEHDGLGFAPAITTDDHGSSAIAGIALYAADRFPPEYRGNLFNGNPVTRRINRDRLDWRGSSPTAVRQTDFLTSDDPTFRPVQVKLGPDGALWIADFCNPIIGHYEVPLTHPNRDRDHGRIWRVVWRGTGRNLPIAPPPDLAALSTPALAEQLLDANLAVRSLAAATLRTRPADPATIAWLRATALRLIDGSAGPVDETTLLPLLFSLETLGAGDDALLRRALRRRESEAAIAALRVLAARPRLEAAWQPDFESLLAAPAPEFAARVAAEVFQREPRPWQARLILAALSPTTAAADFELHYALRLALKANAQIADARTLQTWAEDPAAAATLAETCLAVPTPAAAEFLLEHLRHTKFAGPRAAELLRHAVKYLPESRLSELPALADTLRQTKNSPTLALAEGLAALAAAPNRKLPDELQAWARRELITALDLADENLAYRAIVAVRPLPWSEKAEPLQRIALKATFKEGTRNAALRSLTPGTAETEAALVVVLTQSPAIGVRRTAAELLGGPRTGAEARAALARAFQLAPSDLTAVIATALAKSDAGATDLIALTKARTVTPGILRQRHVALALADRPATLQDQVAALTRDLPPEDARLDAVIARRLGAVATRKGDAVRGTALFATHCAPCHRLRGQGGNIGPSLDGLAARNLTRLVEDILDPSRNVDPTFRLSTVRLRNGDSLAGMNLRREGGRVRLTDPATASEREFADGEVVEVRTEALSPMPAGFDSLLTEAEFVDLLACLRQPPSA
jgi:putative heme-binding domain-containing protein